MFSIRCKTPWYCSLAFCFSSTLSSFYEQILSVNLGILSFQKYIIWEQIFYIQSLPLSLFLLKITKKFSEQNGLFLGKLDPYLQTLKLWSILSRIPTCYLLLLLLTCAHRLCSFLMSLCGYREHPFVSDAWTALREERRKDYLVKTFLIMKFLIRCLEIKACGHHICRAQSVHLLALFQMQTKLFFPLLQTLSSSEFTKLVIRMSKKGFRIFF